MRYNSPDLQIQGIKIQAEFYQRFYIFHPTTNTYYFFTYGVEPEMNTMLMNIEETKKYMPQRKGSYLLLETPSILVFTVQPNTPTEKKEMIDIFTKHLQHWL